MLLPCRARGIVTGVAAVCLASAALAGPVPPPLLPPLPPAARGRVEAVTERPSVATHFAGEPFPARRGIFEFLLDHPDVATQITQALRIARYKVWRTPDGLALDDGWGAVGTFEVVYAAPGTRLMYARGAYQQTLLPDICGQAVVLLDYASTTLPGGQPGIATSLTGYVKLDNGLLAWTTRLASAVARAKAEKEAERLVRVFARTSRAIENDPAAIVALLRQRPSVSERDLEDFRRLLNVPAASDSR